MAYKIPNPKIDLLKAKFPSAKSSTLAKVKMPKITALKLPKMPKTDAFKVKASKGSIVKSAVKSVKVAKAKKAKAAFKTPVQMI